MPFLSLTMNRLVLKTELPMFACLLKKMVITVLLSRGWKLRQKLCAS